MVSFRYQLVNELLPTWLRTGTAGKLFYAIGLHLDLVADATLEGILRSMPVSSLDSGHADGLVVLGRERRINRGVDEPDETYAVRLSRFRPAHRYRGGPYSLLEQLRDFWRNATGPRPTKIELYYSGTDRTGFILDSATGWQIERTTLTWIPATGPNTPYRWKLKYYWSEPLPAKHTWGELGLTWGGGTVWGSGFTPAQVDALRRVPRQWGNAHSRGELEITDGVTSARIAL